jgi:hypothetical protein
MASEPKTGPLTREDFEQIWKSVTDPEYSRSFIERGEGEGYEAHTQAMQQLERVSVGVDRTTQAMYVRPWSGQTAEPASGGRFATVTLEFSRTALFVQAVIIPAGTQVEELATDFGELGGEPVLTGRRYLLTDMAGFIPGTPGPVQVVARADRFGEGYDNPLPGTLTRIVQGGAGLGNTGASVVPGPVSHDLVLAPEPDVITHQQIGQYVLFTAGKNEGQIRLITGVTPPAPDAEDGGSAQLAAMQVFRISGLAGTFTAGETISQPFSGQLSTVILQVGDYLITNRQSADDLEDGYPVIGLESEATAMIDTVHQSGSLVAESETAGWRILSWEELGVAVTNPASPAGGRAAVLDEMGAEREVYRGAEEGDDSYRERVAGFADLVSPKAILRVANRILKPYGYEARLREVGYPDFRGFFYDGDESGVQDPAYAFAYDLNFEARPKQRFMLQLDYTEFRAFFLLGVPKIPLGEFGFAYDEGGYNAYDAAPFVSFLDGYPLAAGEIYKSLWNAVHEAKAGGVGFDLVQEVDETIVSNFIPNSI